MLILFNKRNSRQEYGINSNLSVNVLRTLREKYPKPKMKQLHITAMLHKEKKMEKEEKLFQMD